MKSWGLLLILLFLVGCTPASSNYEQEQIKAYRELIKQNPSDPVNFVNLGWLYYENGDYKEAFKVFNQVAEGDKTNIVARYNLALTLIKLKRLPDATKELELVVQQVPDHADALLTLGQVYLQRKEYEKAKTNFQRFLKLEPTSANGLKGLGDSYKGLGGVEKARAAYQLALNYVPNFEAAKQALEELGVSK